VQGGRCTVHVRGAKPRRNKRQMALLRRLRAEGQTYAAIAARMGVTKQTIYQVLTSGYDGSDRRRCTKCGKSGHNRLTCGERVMDMKGYKMQPAPRNNPEGTLQGAWIVRDPTGRIVARFTCDGRDKAEAWIYKKVLGVTAATLKRWRAHGTPAIRYRFRGRGER
jgi:hypothetical protein